MHKIFKNDTWIKPYLARYKKLLVLVFFLGVLTFFCAIGLMFVAGYLISRSATHPYNILVVYVRSSSFNSCFWDRKTLI